MSRDESLHLEHRFESPHPPLRYPSSLMRLLGPIVSIPIRYMDYLRHHLTMCDGIAAKFVRDNLPRFATSAPQYALKESLRSGTISLGLQVHVNHFTVLIYGPPEIVLLAIDSDEHFIDVEGVAIASVLSLQSSSVNRSELNAPEADGFSANGDSTLSQ